LNKHILLSIQPRIVNEIINGTKTHEFRKKMPNMISDNLSNTIIIYCSSPVMKIIGSFRVGKYFHSDFDALMIDIGATESYKKRIGNYFKDKQSCHAIEITSLNLYKEPISLGELRTKFPGFVPGQSYRYLDPKIKNLIIDLNGKI
tara:strand:- start:95318 stop:95755 length:438 start_codon:yes stop_codon:yes gene_type:complete